MSAGLAVVLSAILNAASAEDGQDGMEYAVVAAVVIVAAATALAAGSPTVQSIVNGALTAVSGAI